MGVKYIIPALALLAGCTSGYTHDAKPAAAFERDLYDCQVQAAAVTDARLRTQMWDRCLRVKGWRTAP